MGTAESVEALYLARASRSTGSLIFQTGARQAKVLWRDGDVVGLELEFGFQSQVQCLLAAGKLSLEQVDGLWARGEAGDAGEELLQQLAMSRGEVQRLQILSTVTKLVQDAEQVTFHPTAVEASVDVVQPAPLNGSELVRSLYRPMTPMDAAMRVRVRDRKGCEGWALTDDDRKLLESMSEFQSVDGMSAAEQALVALLIRAGKVEVELPAPEPASLALEEGQPAEVSIPETPETALASGDAEEGWSAAESSSLEAAVPADAPGAVAIETSPETRAVLEGAWTSAVESLPETDALAEGDRGSAVASELTPVIRTEMPPDEASAASIAIAPSAVLEDGDSGALAASPLTDDPWLASSEAPLEAATSVPTSPVGDAADASPPSSPQTSSDTEWLYADAKTSTPTDVLGGSSEMPLIDVGSVELAEPSEPPAVVTSSEPALFPKETFPEDGRALDGQAAWASVDGGSAGPDELSSPASEPAATDFETQALADAERLVAEAQARVEASTVSSAPPSLWQNSAGFEPWSPGLEESVALLELSEGEAIESAPPSDVGPGSAAAEVEPAPALPAAPSSEPILHAGAEDTSVAQIRSDFADAMHGMSWADAIPEAVAPRSLEAPRAEVGVAPPAPGHSSGAKPEEGDLWNLVNLTSQAHSGQAETLEQALQSESVLEELMSFQLPPAPTSAAPVPELFEATIEESEPSPGKDERMDAASWDEDDLAGDPSDPVEAARLRRQRLLRRAIQNLGAFPQRPAPPTTEGAVSINASEMPAGAATAPASAPSTPTPPEAEAKGEDLAVRTQIEKRFELVQSKPDHFAMLGLERTASRDQVKSAFLSLAKVFHPDRLPPALADLSPKMTQIFEAIRDAYDKIYDDAKRDSYLTELKLKDQRASRHVTPAEEAMEAFRAGEALLKKRDYPAAEAEFLRASGLDNKALFMAARAWILYADPARKDAAKAKQLMTDALKLDPKCERAHYQLGLLARIEGATDKAEKHFREAIRINPKHVEANQELRLIEMRKKKGK